MRKLIAAAFVSEREDLAGSHVLTESQRWIRVRVMCFQGCVQVRGLAVEDLDVSEPELPSGDPGWGKSTQP